MQITQITVAGAGQIGLRHIDIIRANPTCALHSIVDPSPTAAALAQSLGVPHFASLDALLASKNLPDGVVIATPNAMHVPQGLACIARGLACLIEKPLATTLADARAIVSAAQAANVPVLVGHHRRHSGIMAAACAVIAEGRLGKLVSFTGMALLYKAENEGYFEPEWRRVAGGGPIMLNLIHEIGNMRALMGEISAVHAMGSSAKRGFAVEDTASISLRFASGALGSPLGTFMLSDTAASSRSWEHTSGEDPRYHLAAVRDEDCYVVAGTLGSLNIPTMRLKSYASEADRSWHKALHTETLPVADIDPMVAQMAHFMDVIHRRAAPLVSAADGLANLRVVDAILESAKTGLTVTTN